MSFIGEFFKQVFGTRLKNLTYFVNYVLDRFIRRYVDHLILALPWDKITEALNILNIYNQNLKFTVEYDMILDLQITRDDNNILRIKCNRIPVSSIRYINYHSSHTTSMKINLVKYLKTGLSNCYIYLLEWNLWVDWKISFNKTLIRAKFGGILLILKIEVPDESAPFLRQYRAVAVNGCIVLQRAEATICCRRNFVLAQWIAEVSLTCKDFD